MSRDPNVVVVTGMGGMGAATARRIGSGATVLLADVNAAALSTTAATLRSEGYEVEEQVTDVSDPESAAGLGPVGVVVHTAGLSPVQASASAILKVDLLGTALVLDAFASVVAPGGAGVFVASMAGTIASLDPDLERRLASTPAG